MRSHCTTLTSTSIRRQRNWSTVANSTANLLHGMANRHISTRSTGSASSPKPSPASRRCTEGRTCCTSPSRAWCMTRGVLLSASSLLARTNSRRLPRASSSWVTLPTSPRRSPRPSRSCAALPSSRTPSPPATSPPPKSSSPRTRSTATTTSTCSASPPPTTSPPRASTSPSSPPSPPTLCAKRATPKCERRRRRSCRRG
mmetsp:Transcript_9210/g.18375  ORF Transcript_9210/g.18375 Transcript_9210/m.18375 type:complete len:200 (+) Transcript_9210:680-1279(+)